jgi:hypothetical protein
LPADGRHYALSVGCLHRLRNFNRYPVFSSPELGKASGQFCRPQRKWDRRFSTVSEAGASDLATVKELTPESADWGVIAEGFRQVNGDNHELLEQELSVYDALCADCRKQQRPRKIKRTFGKAHHQSLPKQLHGRRETPKRDHRAIGGTRFCHCASLCEVYMNNIRRKLPAAGSNHSIAV